MTPRQANLFSALVGLWVFFVLCTAGRHVLAFLPLSEVLSNDLLMWYFGFLLLSSIAFTIWVLFFKGEREFRS